MLELFFQIMIIISILSFALFFFFGKVRINGKITNKVSYALYGALWVTFIIDLVSFIPVALIILLATK